MSCDGFVKTFGYIYRQLSFRKVEKFGIEPSVGRRLPFLRSRPRCLAGRGGAWQQGSIQTKQVIKQIGLASWVIDHRNSMAAKLVRTGKWYQNRVTLCSDGAETKSVAIFCHLWYLTRMEFTNLVKIAGEEPVFETGLLLSGNVDPTDVRRQLSRWKNARKIYQLRRGLYCLAPPFQKVNPHPFLVANHMVPASYVSLQSALAYFGLIPEHVPVTTSVTTSRPDRWETPLGIFEFRHIQVDFFYGYQFIDPGERQHAFIATPEKALLDLVYLEPGGDKLDYLVELRLENLNRLDWQVFERLARRIKKPKLIRAVEEIRKLAGEEGEFENL
jgi:predicted transcriptional regulator of viral defense system